MAQVSSSFVLRSKYPNFERDSFATFADMESVPSSWMDEGHISYCVAEKSHYIFNSANGTLTGKARWTKIPFTVDASERKVYQVTSNTDLSQYASKGTGTLVYVKNEKEYYAYNGSAFVKLIDINVDSKLTNYYDKSRIGEWSLDTNLVEYIDDIYAKRTDILSADILKSYATESYVENSIGSALYNYVSSEALNNELSTIRVEISNVNSNLDTKLTNQISIINSKFDNYVTENELKTSLDNYCTQLEIGSVLEKYVSLGTFNIEIGSIYDNLNNVINSTNNKFNNYITKTNLNDTLKNYISKDTLNTTLGSYITREEFEATNNSISPDAIKDINNKISTVSAATGAVKQSLDNYKVEVENKYVKTTILESDYVKGSTFQNNAAITTNRLNELEDLIHSNGGVLLKSEFETFKEFAENTYAKPEDISSKLNNYAPAEENRNKWISSDLAGDLSGLTGQEVAARAYSYNAVLDQILFGKFTPEITDPYVDVQLKDDWDGKGYINWYDKEKRIIVVKSGSTGPDGGDFLPINAKDAIISYPKGIDLSTNFTNGILPSTNLKQNSIGFCKIQDENGEWTYYRKDNNIYHVPTTLEVGEYRYYMAAYFQKGSPALNNEGFIVDEWNENTAVESENYITIIASKPTFYNTKSGLIENPLVFWDDNMVDYMTLPPTCHAEQIFMLPKKVKELHIWNDIKGDYALVPMEYQRVGGVITNNLIPSYFDEIIGDDGYYMYKYDINKHGHRGEIKIKVVF